jgi:hypothetical protein
MNLFRFLGDMSHLLSIIVLLMKIRATRSCRGTDWWLAGMTCVHFHRAMYVSWSARRDLLRQRSTRAMVVIEPSGHHPAEGSLPWLGDRNPQLARLARGCPSRIGGVGDRASGGVGQPLPPRVRMCGDERGDCMAFFARFA